MSNHSQNPSKTDDRHTLPRQNVEWAEGFVKWTRYEYVAVYDYPTIHESEQISELYKGDMIRVSLRYRRQDWCLCQIGHVLGWVFLQDVRFILPGAKVPRPQRSQPVQKKSRRRRKQENAYEMETEPVARIQAPVDNYEAETQVPVAPKVEAQIAPVSSEKKPMIERLIRFFKR